MRIAMIGAGYVGLVSGACFADFGHDVACVDLDADKIARLDGGIMPIWEPGLDALVAADVQAMLEVARLMDARSLSFDGGLQEMATLP